jgi:hypothetical protein
MELFSNNCLTFKQLHVVISIFFKLRLANQKERFGFVNINNIFSVGFKLKVESKLRMFFVLISLKFVNKFSSTKTHLFFFK